MNLANNKQLKFTCKVPGEGLTHLDHPEQGRIGLGRAGQGTAPQSKGGPPGGPLVPSCSALPPGYFLANPRRAPIGLPHPRPGSGARTQLPLGILSRGPNRIF